MEQKRAELSALHRIHLPGEIVDALGRKNGDNVIAPVTLDLAPVAGTPDAE